MRDARGPLAFLVPLTGALFQGLASGQEEERERILCDPRAYSAPWNRCPGPRCPCSQDWLEVTFDGKDSSVLSIEPSDVGSSISVVVVIHARGAGIQGWSYGVRHDPEFLTVTTVTMDGTDAKSAFKEGFQVTTAENVAECEELLPMNECGRSGPGKGWIQGVILALTEARELPPGRNSLAVARYTLDRLPPDAGTLLEITNSLRRGDDPPVAITFTREGQSSLPSRVVHGWLRGQGGPPPELCSNSLDDDGDGSSDCLDPDCTGSPACSIQEVCGNEKDDDEDGVSDCRDADCWETPMSCTEICNNRVDDDRDGKVDCGDDDCAGMTFCIPSAEDCGNDLDDDLDGRTDCADEDCSGGPDCSEICDNGEDDDQDGKADCTDAECLGHPSCQEICGNGRDDDADGEPDCWDDDCVGHDACREVCGNFQDDDRDGRSDCYDTDCAADPACTPRDEVCNNGRDEDFDALTDCLDPDCASSEWCNPRDEICDNRWDDDFDRKIDCGDEDCANDEACKTAPPEVCDNARDDDLDLRVDCQDPDCADPVAPNCSAGSGETCGNGTDDDGDGQVDCADADCVAFRPCTALFVRGDVDGNFKINVIDAILSVPIGDLRSPRDCADAQDADDDGRLTVLDAITLITYLFRHGPELAAPYAQCGTDGTPDPLPCMDAPCP